MKRFAFISIFLTLAFSVSFAQNADEIRKLEKQWLIESYKTGDMANYDRIVADDFRITHSNGKVLTKAEKRADIFKNQIKNPNFEDVFAIDDKSVGIMFHGDNIAVSKGHIIENYMWNNKRYLDFVHFTNTYQKRNGNWQVISCHLTRLNQSKSDGEMGYIPVEGDEKIFYQKIGNGKETVIVPLHLYLFDSYKTLAKDRTVIFYDPRNRGRSDRFTDASKFTVQQDVEDLEAVRKHFGVDKMSLIGSSYFGTVVAMYALKYPVYVEKLVQIGPSALDIDKKFSKELTAQDKTPVVDPKESAKVEALKKQGYHKTNPKDYCEKEWALTKKVLIGKQELVDNIKTPCDLPNEWSENIDRHFGTLYPTLLKLDIPETEIAKIKVPVLTVHGTLDRQAAYGAGKEWAEMLPNGRLLTVKGAAHVPHIDEPFFVLSAVENFLSYEPIVEIMPQEISFKSKDGVELFGEIYESAKGKNAPLIMLFHQGGGDARGEYQPLIPRLQKENYNIIAVDTRAGGNRFGTNRTMAKLGDKEYSYCDAYPDLEATLEFAKAKGFAGKKIAWGSSFSAALVFQLAAKRGDELAGILAFSPASGGPMVDCKAALFLEDIKLPVLALRPKYETEFGSVKEQLKLFKEKSIPTYISENGVHGSSMLNDERVQGSVEEHWKAVLVFIKKTLE